MPTERSDNPMSDKHGPLSSGHSESERLTTKRLVLRRWRNEDLEPFAAMNADPEVMRFFPSTLGRAESARLIERIHEHFARHGFGPWALEIPGVAPFAGFTGLLVPDNDLFFTPCVEVLWRVAREHWGRGYAPEAAREAMRDGFERAGLEEIVSYAVEANTASLRVMEKLGMRRNPAEDFEHPKLEPGDPLRPHVLYRISKTEFLREA